MTSSSNPLPSVSAIDLTPLREKWGWIVALGIVYLIAGFIALSSIVTATAVSVFVVGVMMIVVGAAEVINAFQFKGWGRFLFWALIGVLYILAGFATFQNPALAAVVLTLLLGAVLVVTGLAKIFLAFGLKAEDAWLWVAISGLVTLAVGVLILVRWPVSSLYILGIFLAVDLIFAGAGWIGLGLGLYRHRDEGAEPA